MYVNENSGHRQLFVSRLITASVAAHCAQRAKITITDYATGTVKIGRSVPSQVARRKRSRSGAESSS